MRRTGKLILFIMLAVVLAGCVTITEPRGYSREVEGYVGVRKGLFVQGMPAGVLDPEDVIISPEALGADWEPLHGAVVKVVGRAQSEYTDRSGYFCFNRLPIGRRTIRVDHEALRVGMEISVNLYENEPCYLGAAVGGRGYYLVVGIDNYQYGVIGSAAGSERDAWAVGEVFREHSYLAGDVKPLLGHYATRSAIRNAILSIAHNATADDYFVFYFAGRMGADFLCPYDDTGSDWNRSITDRALESWLKEFPGDVTVILDGADSATFADGTIHPYALKKRYYTVLASARAGEDAIVAQESNHGLFTHLLIAGLSTPEERRKADWNRDGMITTREIFDYIQPRMAEYVAWLQSQGFYVNQRPELHIGTGVKNTVILRYQRP